MPTDLSNLDLNLLVTLDALLGERSVTKAAGRLGVTQPAVSASLGRLRRHFDDVLLNRVGNYYELTPLAARLRADTGLALASVRRVFEAAPDFEPSQTDREFSLVLSDYAAAVMGEDLSRMVAARAPKARLRIELVTPWVVDHVSETLRVVDGFVLPHGFINGTPHTDLFEDDWVGIVSADRQPITANLTLQELAQLPWVMTFDSRTAFTPALQHLRLIGVDPQTAVVVQSFLATPFFVAGTDRVALMQRRLVERMANLTDIRSFELPFDAGRLVESFWWHPVRSPDPAHTWLRGLVRAVGRRLVSSGSGVDPGGAARLGR